MQALNHVLDEVGDIMSYGHVDPVTDWGWIKDKQRRGAGGGEKA